MVDSVLNRPLFRGRSGMEMEARRVVPSVVSQAGIPAALTYRDLVEKARRGDPITYDDYAKFASGENITTQQAQDVLAMVENPGYVPSNVEVDIATRPNLMSMPSTVADPEDTRGIRAITGYLGGVFGGQTLGDAQRRRQEDALLRQEFQDYTASGGFEAALQQMRENEEALFGTLDRAAGNIPRSSPSGMEMEARGSRPPAPLGVSGMEAEARGSRLAVPVPEATAPESAVPGATVQGPSPMEADARARAPLLSNPQELVSGMNAPDPTVRERTVKDYMQEFIANAPKYEGGDKRLMHAMIGFAIAAGESPNAMTNIAKGLQAGAEMFLKDKAAKDEFDRQIQLTAMQYGMEESGKARARAREPLKFVAIEDTTYDGKPVKAGQSVYIPYGVIEQNGGVVPPGFGDSETVTAIGERANLVLKAIEDDRKERLLDDTFAESQRVKFSEAASKAMSAQRGIDYMEQALITIGEGGVAGLKGSANQVAQNLAAAIGLDDVAAQFDNREDALAAVSKGFQNLIPVAFSGTQTGNSISNFDVENLAKAYVDAMFKDGVFSMAFVTDDKLKNSLKGALELLESGRQSALTDMNAIEGQLVNRTLKSGLPASTLVEPYRALVPVEDEIGVPSAFGSLYRSDDGVYRLRTPGG